jgi:hypothetical protein
MKKIHIIFAKKKYMKKLVMVLLIGATVLQATAQKDKKDNKLKFSVSGEFGAVTGNLKTNYSVGIGPSAQVEYKINDKFSATVQGGVLALVSKKIPGSNLKLKSQTTLPLLGGVKYYFMPKLFGAAQVGAAIFTTSGNDGARFAFSPSVGYQINDKFDVSLKYTGFVGDNTVTSVNVFGPIQVPTSTTASGESGVFGIRVGYTL